MKSKIREKVSTILGIYIPKGKWGTVAEKIEPSGEPTRIRTTKILFAICEELENLSQELEAYTPVEAAEAK